MKTLELLKKEILEDGIIDATEVKEIETVIYADGTIDKEEADFLFELNDGVSGKENDASWKDLFVKAISSFVLDDEESNGEIDADETAYLVGKIQGDGTIDLVEEALLVNLKSNLGSLPEALENLLK
ncbi:TerB family tellurite resistance protein [Tenacibaculum finnmarkense]|uniref:TerB family tellurite resistance protein n=1 Tax=Tenacibaculum finnmarkense TaxID=2781243 RepID=UPI00187B56F0|nr:TerB family tellurite resistance protein [Tenacibaculum finnmarkense]MBE7648257.1 TerB family tellurite resistance protein [Tenacibaculum finnmarkense genomovar ulcerans]